MRRLRNANTDRVDCTVVMCVRVTGSSVSCTMDGGLLCLCTGTGTLFAMSFTAAGSRKQWGVFR